VVIPFAVKKNEWGKVRQHTERENLEHSIVVVGKHIVVLPYRIATKPYKFHYQQAYNRPYQAQ
jgi:ribosomal protein L25 (general stress protein Ctc)